MTKYSSIVTLEAAGRMKDCLLSIPKQAEHRRAAPALSCAERTLL